MRKNNEKNSVFLYDPTTIIMPVLNNWPYTQRCIDSILSNTTEQFEFLIINNASTDETKEKLSSICLKDERFRIIENEKNIGVSASWNQGIREAKYSHVCIINNDIEVMTKNWLYIMQKILKNDHSTRWVGPMTCYDPDRKVKYVKTHYEQIPYNDKSMEYVVGCCMYFPKSIFEEIGYFDEKFEVRYYEDLDFMARLWTARYKTKMAPVLVYHAVGKTSRITDGGDGNLAYFNSKWGKTQFNIEFFRGDRFNKRVQRKNMS
jgi:O-antigen biosynthesis protein